MVIGIGPEISKLGMASKGGLGFRLFDCTLQTVLPAIDRFLLSSSFSSVARLVHSPKVPQPSPFPSPGIGLRESQTYSELLGGQLAVGDPEREAITRRLCPVIGNLPVWALGIDRLS
jgi:hypothetical protein